MGDAMEKREFQDRLIGIFLNCIDDRDPDWMIRQLDADDCYLAARILARMDKALHEQYLKMGGGAPVTTPVPAE